MADNLIQIKRSDTTAVPGSLADGELAFTSNGYVLFIGANGAVEAIAGKRNPGTLTANQALVANSTSGIDKVIVANLVPTAIYANGSLGSAGQVLVSNGTAVFWGTGTSGSNTEVQFNDSGVANGSSNFTFNKSTNTLTVTNLAGNGALVTSVNAATVGGNTASDLRSYSDTVAGTAYSNAVSSATALAGNAYSNAVSAATALAGNAYSNAVSAATALAGNAYSNAVSEATSLAGNAYSNAVSAATALAGNAYSNAVSAATALAGNAYSNAISYADTVAGTAYSNAIAYAASNTYVNSTFATNTYVNSTFATNSYVTSTFAALSGATFTGAASFVDLTVTGNTKLGDASSDVVSIVASVNTSIMPSANATYNLGNNTIRWQEVHAQNVHSEYLYIDKDVQISGNLTVTGNVTTINVATLSVTDSLIQLATNNTSSDLIDIGVYGNYQVSGGNHEHTGFFRDATDGNWKLFVGLQDAPTSTIDTAGVGYAKGTLDAYLLSGGLESNGTNIAISANSTLAVAIVANTLSLSTPLAVTSGGTGYNSYTAGDILTAANSSTFSKLGLGTSGYVLQSNGTALVYDTLDGGTF